MGCQLGEAEDSQVARGKDVLFLEGSTQDQGRGICFGDSIIEGDVPRGGLALCSSSS